MIYILVKEELYVDLQRCFFVPEGLSQALDVLLLVIDLLHGLTQVGLQLVVRVGSLLRQIIFDGQSFY